MAATLAEMVDRKSAWSRVCDSVAEWCAESDKPTPEELLKADPCRMLIPLGLDLDPWQRLVLESTDTDLMLLCSRQSGKSQTMAELALLEAVTHPYSEVLIISRSLRQSVELLRKVKELWRGLTGGRVNRRRKWSPKTIQPEVKDYDQIVKDLGWDGAALVGEDMRVNVREKALTHDFPNGSRITSLPGNPDTIVGFSAVTLLIIDEASRVSDALLSVSRPFLAATEEVHGRKGRLVVASTPFGKRGWFYDGWRRTKEAEAKGEKPPWRLIEVTAAQCPRIKQDFLDRERRELGERWFMQEYFCTFVDAVDSVFSHDLIQAMLQETETGPAKLWFE